MKKYRKRILAFIVIFVLFGVSNYVLDCVFRPSKIDYLREFSVALGVSFGITFFDLVFLKKNKKSE